MDLYTFTCEHESFCCHVPNTKLNTLIGYWSKTQKFRHVIESCRAQVHVALVGDSIQQHVCYYTLSYISACMILYCPCWSEYYTCIVHAYNVLDDSLYNTLSHGDRMTLLEFEVCSDQSHFCILHYHTLMCMVDDHDDTVNCLCRICACKQTADHVSSKLMSLEGIQFSEYSKLIL